MLGLTMFGAALAAMFTGQAVAAPAGPQYPGAPPFDQGDVNNYVTWIVSNYFTQPSTLYERCIFYNAVWGDPRDRDNFYRHLYNIRDAVNGVTLYDVYPGRGASNDPFSLDYGPRRFFDDQELERDWFRITSRAFAARCRGDAYLIWNRNTDERPFHRVTDEEIWDAIWATDEFDEIVRNPDNGINRVFIIDPDTGVAERTPFWTRNGALPQVPYILTGLQWPTPPGYGNNTDAGGKPAKRSIDASEPVYNAPRRFPSLDEMEFAKNYTGSPRKPASVDLSQYPEFASALAKRQTFTFDPIEARTDAVYVRYQNRGYAPGVCQVQFTQTIFEPDILLGSVMNISIYDDGQLNLISDVENKHVADATSFDVYGRLPYSMIVSTGALAFANIRFRYAGQDFNTGNDQCVTSSWTGTGFSEHRGGACNFTCIPYANL